MSGQTVPADFSEHMLDLDEDEDLEVFSKVKEAEEGRAKAEGEPPSPVVAHRREWRRGFGGLLATTKTTQQPYSGVCYRRCWYICGRSVVWGGLTGDNSPCVEQL